LPANDLLIAIARPTGRSDDPLPIGIAGRGFDGDLTSDSTRLDGYVLSTDLAPTILERFGLEVPSEMSGQAIRADGSVDPAALVSLANRMEAISPRRGPVIGLSLLLWLAALGLAILVSAGRGGPDRRAGGRARGRLPAVDAAGPAPRSNRGRGWKRCWSRSARRCWLPRRWRCFLATGRSPWPRP
jgi:hypothetical protein